MKIRPVRADLFHVDGRTDGQPDMTKPIVVFRNFATAAKNCNKVFLKNSTGNFLKVGV
jgi:hypothetical protein